MKKYFILIILLLFSCNGNTKETTMKFVQTDNAPKAVGPYSQAVWANDTLYISGQIPIDPATQELKLFDGNVVEQTKLVLSNVKGVLESQGLTVENVVKAGVFIKDMNDFGAVNDVYASFFGNHKPARACVEVARLPKDVQIEIEVIAVK
jgi:2-iminobutanoate/2-iminopropanoate deaminase